MNKSNQSLNVDMSVTVKRFPDSQTYKVVCLVHSQGGAIQTVICQTLPEVFQIIAEFEQKHMHKFDNAIDYEHVNWRELARQNRQAQQTPVALVNPNREQSK